MSLSPCFTNNISHHFYGEFRIILYLACPYAHADPEMMRKRYHASCRAAAKLMKDGITIFNPLANTVPAVELGGLEFSHDEFVRLDLEILRRCDEILILGLENWEKSDGQPAVTSQLAPTHFVRVAHDANRNEVAGRLPGCNAHALPKTYLTSEIFHEKCHDHQNN